MDSFRPYAPVKGNAETLLKEAKKGYYCFASRETCLARDEVWISWLLNHGCSGFIDLPNKRVYDYFVHEKSYLATLASLAQRMIVNWNTHINEYMQRKKRLLAKAQGLGKKVHTCNKKEILKVYYEYIDGLYHFGEYIWAAWAVIHHMEPEVMKQFPEQIALITALEEPIDFLSLQKEIFRIPTDESVKRYGWLKMYSPYDTAYTEEEINNLKKETNQKQIEKQFREFEKVQRDFNQFVDSITDTPLQTKVKAVHTYAYLKTERIDTWRQAMWLTQPFYNYLSHLTDRYTLKDVTNLTIHECVELLERGTAPSLHEIQQRSNTQALYFFHHTKIEIITDTQSIEKTREIVEGKNTPVDKIQGIIACQGKVRGTVKIVTHSDHLSKIKEGDIMVAKYTFPNFTPVMCKCSAIVTDDGGLTSHAAVVSREFKIPCIVGTKVATRIFKDGDVVEVDATRGIVRKML